MRFSKLSDGARQPYRGYIICHPCIEIGRGMLDSEDYEKEEVWKSRYSFELLVGSFPYLYWKLVAELCAESCHMSEIIRICSIFHRSVPTSGLIPRSVSK